PSRSLLRLLRCSADELPGLDRRWWSVLIAAYIRADWPSADPKHIADISRRLKADGLLDGRDLQIRESHAVRYALSLSESKVDGCVAIHHAEHILRGDTLRQVFLTDFIREGDDGRLGAWSIFRRLVR